MKLIMSLGKDKYHAYEFNDKFPLFRVIVISIPSVILLEGSVHVCFQLIFRYCFINSKYQLFQSQIFYFLTTTVFHSSSTIIKLLTSKLSYRKAEVSSAPIFFL